MLAPAYQPQPRAPAAEQKPLRLLRVNDVAAQKKDSHSPSFLFIFGV